MSVGAGFVAGGLLFLFAPVIATEIFDSPTLTRLLRVGAVGVPFVVLRSVSVSLARSARDARTHALVNQLIQPASRLVFIAIFVFAGFEALGALVGQLTAMVLAGFLALVLAWRVLPSFETPPESMYRSLLVYSLPLIAVQGMGFLNSNVDIYMIGYLVTSSAVGVYNIALQVSNILTAVISTGGFLLAPVVTRLHENGNDQEMVQVYQGTVKWILIIAIPIFLVLFFASELIIGLLFGESYVNGAWAMRILLLGNIFNILMGETGGTLIGLGKNRIVAYVSFVQVSVNTALNLFLVPIYGIEGAAVAMAISFGLGDILRVGVLYRDFDVQPFGRNNVLLLSSVTVFCLLGYGMVSLFSLPLATVIVFVLSLYPFAVLRLLEPEDERLLTQVENKAGMEFTTVRGLIYRYS